MVKYKEKACQFVILLRHENIIESKGFMFSLANKLNDICIISIAVYVW